MMLTVLPFVDDVKDGDFIIEHVLGDVTDFDGLTQLTSGVLKIIWAWNSRPGPSNLYRVAFEPRHWKLISIVHPMAML